MEERDDYKFLKLSDAVSCLNQRVNLVGVVLELGLPKKSKGTDFFISLKIADESYSDPGISVNFFAESVEKLPVVASPGDIILLSHVVMKTHEREVYAFFNKKFSSFALYEGISSGDFSPYQVSARFRTRELDKKFIADLRKWLTGFQLNTDPNDFQFLREIKEGQRLSLILKILHIHEVAEKEWVIYVWDGTDAPSKKIQTKMTDEMDNPLPLQLEKEPLPRDVLCTFPSVGSVLMVVLGEGNKNLGLGFLKTGMWLNFLNIICEVHAGLWRGVLMPFTKLRYVPKEYRYVLGCQRCYEERLSEKWGRMPWSCFPSPSTVTEVEHDHVPPVTLRDVLTYPEVTAKFKCVIRVVAAFPCEAENFLSPAGIYRVRLTIEDPTARVHAFLYAEDGENFFDGHPSTCVLKRRMNKLLGLNEDDDSKGTEYTDRNPPWVFCCLKSYYLNESDVWGSRRYQIFDTKLVG